MFFSHCSTCHHCLTWFACNSNDLPGERVFSVLIEDEETKKINNLDIVKVTGNKFIALTKAILDIPVTDGFLTIDFQGFGGQNPKINAIEVIRIGDHAAHAVIGGPYFGVDVDGDGFQNVSVNTIESHTHGITNGVPNVLISYVWKKGVDIIGTGVKTNLYLPVGDNEVTLTVVDNTGSISYDEAVIRVEPVGYPVLFSLSPATGNTIGGTTVTITGQDIGNVTSVRFGPFVLTSGITVINSGTIQVQSPGPAIGIAVKVSVNTTRGESNAVTFTYVGSTPIQFDDKVLVGLINSPTAVAFGPDGKLYVGSQSGNLTRLTLNDAYDQVVDMQMVNITGGSMRCILGIAFNPLETQEMGSNISVYISTSLINHDGPQNSAGDGINGKVQRVWGANLENIADVVVGLPVSRIDHAVSFCDPIVRIRCLQCRNYQTHVSSFFVLQINGLYFGAYGLLSLLYVVPQAANFLISFVPLSIYR
jgi:Malectin domain/IPT/TIG domain